MPPAARLLVGCLILASLLGLFRCFATENGLAGQSLARNEVKSPRAVVDETECNFGRVPIGKDLVATFTVKNEGTRRLILAEQGGCCGSAKQEIIVPSRRAKEFSFSLRTTQRQLGPHRDVVRYQTNDRLHPVLVFTVVFELTSDGLHPEDVK